MLSEIINHGKTDQPKNPFTKETLNEKWKNCNPRHTEDNKLIVWQEFFFIETRAVNQAYKGSWTRDHETHFGCLRVLGSYNSNLTIISA
jgi:hypothetical protein